MSGSCSRDVEEVHHDGDVYRDMSERHEEGAAERRQSEGDIALENSLSREEGMGRGGEEEAAVVSQDSWKGTVSAWDDHHSDSPPSATATRSSPPPTPGVPVLPAAPVSRDRDEQVSNLMTIQPTMRSAALPPKPQVRKVPKKVDTAGPATPFEPPPQDSSQLSTPNTQLTADLTGSEVACVLRAVCGYLEGLDTLPEVKKAYAQANGSPGTSARDERLLGIVRELSGGGDGTDVLSKPGQTVEDLTYLVLRIAEEQGSILLPS